MDQEIKYIDLSRHSDEITEEEITQRSKTIKTFNKKRNYSIEEIIEFSKGNQKYQKRLFFGFCFSQMLLGMISVSLIYFFFSVKFKCKSENGLYDCSEKEACTNELGFKIISERFSLINQFELYCKKSVLKNISICLIIFIGGILYYFASCFSDIIGRRTTFRLTIIIGFVGFFLLFISPNLLVSTFGLILLCLTADTCHSLSFIYMSEISQPKLRNISSLAMVLSYFFGEMFGGFAGSILHDYRSIAIFYFVLSFPMFIFFFYLRPTFYYLHKRNKIKEFLKLLNFILKSNKIPVSYMKAKLNNNNVSYFNEDMECKSNSTELTNIENNQDEDLNIDKIKKKLELNESDLNYVFDLSLTEETTPSISIRQYFNSCKKVMELMGYLFLVMNVYWIQGLTAFLPEKMGLNKTYLNILFLAFADVLGVSIMVFFLNSTSRITLNRVHLLIMMIASLLTILLHNFSGLFFKIFDILLSCKLFNHRFCQNECIFCNGIYYKL